MMTLQDQLDALASWEDALERAKRATYEGSAKELRNAWNDADYVRHHITEGTGLTPNELTESIRVWRQL